VAPADAPAARAATVEGLPRMRRMPATPKTDARFSCEVRVQFLEEKSNPPDGPFAFAYTVKIRNTGTVAGQLVARHWVITDAKGHEEEVRGLAVVGHQPLLKPGEQFEYTSWTRIDTPHGQMRGTYFCMSEDAYPFEAEVPEFQLVYPGLLQ
jgi:ApaG protein